MLINRKLIELARPSGKWIFSMVFVKLALLFTVMYIFSITGSIQGLLYSSKLTPQLLLNAVLVMSLIALVRFVGNLIDGELAYKCSADLRIDLRHKIYKKMLDLGIGYSESMGTSNAVTASVDGIEALETYFSKYLPALIYCFIAPFILFSRMNGAAPEAAWVLLTASLIVLPINQLFRKVVRLLKGEYWSKFANLNTYYYDSLEGLNTFVLYDSDEKRREDLSEKCWDFRNVTMKVLRLNFNSVIISEMIIYISSAIAILFISQNFVAGGFGFGRAIFLLLLADTFFAPVRDLMSTGHSAMNGVAAAENVFGLLKLKSKRNNLPIVENGENKKEDGFILKDVSFQYNTERKILNNISMTIEKGKVTAIVGQSGCGKSTIANLLMRFYDVQEGKVSMEGQDIKTQDPQNIHEKVCIVPQNTYIFTGTILDNLKMAKTDATVKEMMNALDMVNLSGFVKQQPEGLDTNVGEGGCKLSGGQKQKLGIARAILMNAEFYIFDEATSNVDVESEDDIWKCIGKLARRNTLLVISHRLSTIKKADCIYVMDQGEIKEKGNHGALMKKRGLYYFMVTEQESLEGLYKGGELCVS
ncbi:ABC transporter ATP-binding protein/permease [Acetobacterium bakii]|uniref:ABC transporter ATP-binding protein/permease n=1 Tax=Acetobacterium bakii TaxID=52689 RepID=UPI0013B43E84|nr:ATP-binding cassette domain-containing protein [Acetobacterium bakii]